MVEFENNFKLKLNLIFKIKYILWICFIIKRILRKIYWLVIKLCVMLV